MIYIPDMTFDVDFGIAVTDRMKVDSELSPDSENPLQNKAVYAALEKKQDKADYALRSEVEAVRVELSAAAEKQEIVNTETDKRLTNLEKGIPAEQFMTDSSAAYIKDVPANALPFAELSSVGGITRKCKNLIPYPYIETSQTDCGITVTDNGDGSITFNGTATADFFFDVSYRVPQYLDVPMIVSFGEGTGDKGLRFIVGYKSIETNGSKYLFDSSTLSSGTITIPSADLVDKYFIAIRVPSGKTVDNVTVYPQLELGTEATEYEPYFEGLRSAPVTAVESIGANLFDKSKITTATVTDTGFSFVNENNRDSPVTIGMLRDLCPDVKAGDKITFYADVVNSQFTNGFFYLTSSSMDWYEGDFATITETDINAGYILAYGQQNTVCEYNNVIFTKNADTAYTPYIGKNTLDIPDRIRSLDGYGWGVSADCYNYIDFEKKQFVKRVGRVDMGTLNWTLGSVFYASIVDKKASYNLISSNYNTFIGGISDLPNNSLTINTEYGNYLYIKDTTYADAAAFKSAMSGEILYYELAEPVITDLSEILPDDNYIGVEGNGTVRFMNEYEYDVPSEITYMLKEE